MFNVHFGDVSFEFKKLWNCRKAIKKLAKQKQKIINENMAHYRMLDREPSAIITVAGSEKKIYQGGQIFINDGENFEIRFFNPLQEKIGVETLFNGQKKNDGLLVLKPGEDIILDRFLGEKKKMKFETYTINGENSAAVQAAALNGLVEFKFYKEKNTYNNFAYFNGSTTTNNFSYTSSGYGIGNLTRGISQSWTPIGTSSTANGTFSTASATGPATDSIDYSEYVCENKDASLGYQDYLAESTEQEQVKTPLRTKSLKKETLETGRVEKGPESKQDLKTVEMEFDTNPFHTITYQLKPTSALKQTEVTEIRNYCTGCGYRIRKSSWNNCPKCGEKL